MNNAKPTPFSYVLVISALIVGAMYMICNTEDRVKKLDRQIISMDSKEKIVFLNNELKKFKRYEKEYAIENLDESKYSEAITYLTRTLKYEYHDEAKNTASFWVMAFFVLIAIGIGIIKYVMIVIYGFRSAKSIIRNR